MTRLSFFFNYTPPPQHTNLQLFPLTAVARQQLIEPEGYAIDQLEISQMYSCISNYSFFCERLLVHLTLDLNQSMPDPDLSLTSVCYCAVEVFRETWKLKVGGGKKKMAPWRLITTLPKVTLISTCRRPGAVSQLAGRSGN